jgi:hypothetical protein
MERIPCNTGESRGRRIVTQNRKTPSGGSSEFAKEPVDVAAFDGECGLDFTKVERRVSHAVERMRKGGGGETGAMTALGVLYARVERQREKSGALARCASKWRRREKGGGGLARRSAGR